MRICGEKMTLIMSSREADTYDPESGTILSGATRELWQTCGKKPGHKGEHGGYGSRMRHWRFKFECWRRKGEG